MAAAPIAWSGKAALLVAAVWLAASYALMAFAPGCAWNGAVIVGPMLGSFALYAWQQRWWWAAVAGFAGVVALVWAGLAQVALPMPWLYVAQHAVIHLALAALFALTLRPGRMPLITRLAEPVHGDRFTAAMAAYTRVLTAVWAGYFAAMAAVSLLLFAFAPFGWWAAFANFGTPLSLVALFVGEHVLRYQLHPEFDRATIADAIGAWKKRQAAS